MAHFERGAKQYSFAQARQLCQSKDVGKVANSLRNRVIDDNLKHLSLPIRCAIHCIAWIVVRSFSKRALRHIQWTEVSGGAESITRQDQAKRRCRSVPPLIADLLHLLNRRNVVCDYIRCDKENSKQTPWKNTDRVTDHSSMLAVCTRHAYHDVTRLEDAKWAEIRKAFFELAGKPFLQAIIISFWVFTRYIPFVRFFDVPLTNV